MNSTLPRWECKCTSIHLYESCQAWSQQQGFALGSNAPCELLGRWLASAPASNVGKAAFSKPAVVVMVAAMVRVFVCFSSVERGGGERSLGFQHYCFPGIGCEAPEASTAKLPAVASSELSYVRIIQHVGAKTFKAPVRLLKSPAGHCLANTLRCLWRFCSSGPK